VSDENSKQKDAKLVGNVVAGAIIVFVAIYLIKEMWPETKPSEYPGVRSQEVEKVVTNQAGRITIKTKGDATTSVKLEALSEGQKEGLQAMLLSLEVPKLVALRACSFTLTFGDFEKGVIHNCEGERVGTLSNDAVGYLRDQMVAKLKEREK
jgi:hypothetical protein